MKNQKYDIDSVRSKFKSLIDNFESELTTGDLRQKVRSLIPIFHYLRSLGKSLIDKSDASSARERILFYFRKYPRIVIKGDELLIVSAIQEYARRVRELRVRFGWLIINGTTAKEMAAEDEFPPDNVNIADMKPDDYILLSEDEDRDAAHRWNIANEIRKSKESARIKILEYLKRNVGKQVTGEELRYVAKGRTEWARRVRELRTEFGWPVETKQSVLMHLQNWYKQLAEAVKTAPECPCFQQDHKRRKQNPIRIYQLQAARVMYYKSQPAKQLPASYSIASKLNLLQLFGE